MDDENTSGTVEEYETVCINFDKCGGKMDIESGIHQFCRTCYQKWASAWFKGGEN